GHQGLDISYNVLNFPKEITNDEGMTATYTYLSDGSKRSVCTHDGLGKLYRGSFVYDGGSDVGSSVSWESIATPEGRLVSTTDGILDLWYAKDYLGNARSVIDLASGVIEENDYLPFGTRIQDDNQTTLSDNRWRYANKEEQASLVGGSCNLIDFGARNYDPWSARWTTTDPMAQKYVGMSPYNYCAGNPVMMVDDDGRKPRVYIETKGFGHAFLTTGEGHNLTIYTMGRTGNIPRLIKKIGLSGVSPVGEGVLSVLRGEDAKKYLSDRTSNGIHYSIFEFDGDDSKVDEHFQSLFNNGTDPTGGISMNKEYAKVISEYVLFYNNCVTTTIGGLASAGIDVVSERGTLLLSPTEFISEIMKSNIYCEFYLGEDAQNFVKNLIDELSNK
ncbi:MAG: RHS repeat-associated core domain-containing protein, partial [Bacteroidales bacterium]|nr:RHS repeat-associated core domain-containing protein [Bacteroidales bacterium]